MIELALDLFIVGIFLVGMVIGAFACTILKD